MKLLSANMDGKVLEELYKRYARKLISFSSRMLANKEKAEDVVQEVFIKIIEKPESFDWNQRFSTWIYTLAHNLCLNTIRNEHNRDRLLEENYDVPESFTQHSTLDMKVIKEQVNAIFKELSEKEKAVVHLPV